MNEIDHRETGNELITQLIELTGLTRFRAEEILRKAQWQKDTRND